MERASTNSRSTSFYIIVQRQNWVWLSYSFTNVGNIWLDVAYEFLLSCCASTIIDNNFKGLLPRLFFRSSHKYLVWKEQELLPYSKGICCWVEASSLPGNKRARLVNSEAVKEEYSTHTWVTGAVSGTPGCSPGAKQLVQEVQDFSSSHLNFWWGWLRCSWASQMTSRRLVRQVEMLKQRILAQREIFIPSKVKWPDFKPD